MSDLRITASRVPPGTATPSGWLLPVLVVAWLIVVVSQAWVGEDAHITMRTVDNFVNGRGMRWNPDERVQTFTHPLWLLTVSAAYAFTREIPWTLTVVGLVCSGAAFTLLLKRRFALT